MITKAQIGPEKPVGRMRTMRYRGPISKLQGQLALVAKDAGGHTVAQFYDPNTGYAYGWWQFPATNFGKVGE